MAAGSRRAVRGSACVSFGLACLVMAGLALGLHGAQAPRSGPRGAIDPAVGGFRPRVADPLATAPEAPPTRIVLGPHGRDVRLSGELTEGAAERLGRLLDAHGEVERIHLTSEGGLVDEGAAIGALIAQHGLVTYVPDYCVSACTLAFVRGRARLVLAEARLGFHAPYETGPFGVEIAADSAPERAAYLAAGLKPDFVDAALKVRPDDLMIPDAATLVKAGVATGIVDAYRFPDSTLDGADDPADARRVLLQTSSLMRSIDTQAPWIVDRIARSYLALYRAGLSEGEVTDRLRQLASRFVLAALAQAEPATLVEFGRTLARAMERSTAGHPRAGKSSNCAAIGSGDLFLAQSVLGEEARAGARAILARALAHAPPIAPANDEVDSSAQTPTPASACAGLRHAYETALALPQRAAAEALRGLLFRTLPAPTLEATARP